jgi:hypothetical protein
MENSSYRDNAKARAMRDIQLAHSKDVHGNWFVRCFFGETRFFRAIKELIKEFQV